MKSFRSDSGFTLVELVISMGLYSLIALIISFLFVQQLKVSNQSRINSQADDLMINITSVLKDEDGCSVNFANSSSPYNLIQTDPKKNIKVVLQSFKLNNLQGLYYKKKSATTGGWVRSVQPFLAVDKLGKYSNFGEIAILNLQVDLKKNNMTLPSPIPTNWKGEIFGEMKVDLQLGLSKSAKTMTLKIPMRFIIDNSGNVVTCQA
jgi:prepilin-type N-terminal cleavage/methylation domain-containing protein